MKPLRYSQEAIDRFVREGPWGTPTIADLWDKNAQLYGDREAIVDSRTRLTWAEAKRLMDRLALQFHEMGLEKDEVVAMQLPNIAEYMVIRAALKKAGLLGLPILLFFRQRELLYTLKHTDAVAVVSCGEFRGVDYTGMVEEMRPELPHLRHHFVVSDQERPGTISIRKMLTNPVEERYPADYLAPYRFKPGEIGELLMTSGTTGMPKIIQNVEDALFIGSRMSGERWRYTAEDIVLALAPIPGGPSGSPTWHISPHFGSKSVLMEKFEPEAALALIEKERVTVATGVPAQMTMMVKHPSLDKYDYSSLRVFYYAGSVCAPALADEIEAKMGCKVLTRLGMMDAGSVATVDYDDPPEVRWYSVGKPLIGIDLRLVDDDDNEVPTGASGEIVVSGPGCVAGFHNEPERTMEAWGELDGWYHSGDLGRLDADGNLYLVGRKKDLIIRGGQNIYPIEVENLLQKHPSVGNVAVVPMPDPVMGEKACAFVIPRPGCTLCFEDMIGFLRETQIAPYKLPERLEIVDSFPLGSDGQKVLKKALTEQVTRLIEAERSTNF